MVRRDGGSRLFQTSGPQTANARRPSSVRVRRVTDAQVDAERRDQTRIQLWADQAAASPLGLGFCAFTVRKCTKFGQLTLRRITKIVAIRCQISRLKCSIFDFGWAPPDSATGVYSPPQAP